MQAEDRGREGRSSQLLNVRREGADGEDHHAVRANRAAAEVNCDKVKLPEGGVAIVCSRGRRYRCCACTLAGGFQCDWKVSPTKTCDRYICPDHALLVAPEKHLCPEHQEAYKAWLAAREAAA